MEHSMDDRTPSRFEYQQLETSTSIRILAIAPGAGNEPLRGTLEHFDLELLKSQHAHFDALSYVWGHVVYDRPFECQTGIVLITKSLEEALQKLRSSQRTQYIWADGVCINQQDRLERESQVKLMGQVYTRALQVKIWLGPDPTHAARRAFNFIRQYGRIYVHKLDIATWEDSVMDWSPLAELVKLEYFKRIWQRGAASEGFVDIGKSVARLSWAMLMFCSTSHSAHIGSVSTDSTPRVIQEGLLNQSGIFFWGDNEIALSDVSVTLSLLMDRAYFHDSFRQSFSWISQRLPVSFCDGYDIFQVLQWVRCRDCLDDRDRIFAVLGLRYHARYPWNAVIRNIEPDYSQPVDDLYERLACDISKLGGTLRVLSAVHHSSHLQAWAEGVEPSWIPNWNRYVTSDLKHNDLRGRWFGNELRTRHCLFYPASLDLHYKSMTLDCVRYDTVTLISDSLLHADRESPNAGSIHDFCREALHHMPSARSTQLDFAWNTINIGDSICGTANYFQRPEAELFGARNLIKVLCRQHAEHDLGEAEQFANRQLCVELEASLQAVQEHNPDLKDDTHYESPVHPAERLRHRRLFLTQRNQVGLGPEAMRQGDVVVNLKGSTLPLVIRPQGSFYRFVGAARMPESMRLDAMAQAEQEGAKIELIEIR